MKIKVSKDGIFIPKEAIRPVRIVNDFPNRLVTFAINFSCSIVDGTEVIEFLQGLGRETQDEKNTDNI